MKKILLALLVCNSTLAYTQTHDVIVGTWNANWDNMLSQMTSSERQHYQSLPEQARARIQASFDSREFKFMANGNVEVSWSTTTGQRLETGMWVLSGDTLTMTISGEQRMYLVNGSGQTLVLRIQNQLPGAIFSTLVFVKQ